MLALAKQWLDDASRLLHTLLEGALELKRIDGIEIQLQNLRPLLKLRQKVCAVSLHERPGHADRCRFGVSDSTQVEEIPSLRAVAPVPHLLGDDYGACLDLDVAIAMGHDIERRVGQRRSDNDIDLSGRQIEFEVLRVLLIVRADLLCDTSLRRGLI